MPLAVLLLPVVLNFKAFVPSEVLLVPVVLYSPLFKPMKVLPSDEFSRTSRASTAPEVLSCITGVEAVNGVIVNAIVPVKVAGGVTTKWVVAEVKGYQSIVPKAVIVCVLPPKVTVTVPDP